MAKKNINNRCPLSMECERKKCEFVNHELDCEYYANNGIGDSTIQDQEDLRRERDRETEENAYAEAVDDVCTCSVCDKTDCVCAGGCDAAGRYDCYGDRNCAQDGCSYDAKHIQTPTEDAQINEQGRIEYIPIDLLHPHPDNPRKDVGDVSELADSIKANGILQNLTVVPGYFMSKAEYIKMAKAEGVTKAVAEASYDAKDWPQEDGFTVIIGHRRLAAAKIAGLSELPCVVVEMSERDQVATMLTENMQRTDLTTYEQAQGFQMMLDFGDSVDEIAERSGFSKATVRRRVKLLDLDKEKFKKAESRGATIQDYMELDKLEDPALKNKVLDAIGTPNFKYELKSAIDAEKLKIRMDAWLLELKSFATEIEKRDYIGDVHTPMDYIRNYGRWSKSDDAVERPDDLDTVKYYYKVNSDQIDLYRDHQERVITEEEQRKAELREAAEKKQAELDELTGRCYDLRVEFISNFGAAKKSMPDIVWFASNALIGDGEYGRNEVDADLLSELLEFEVDENADYDTFKAAVREKAKDVSPEYFLLVCAYAASEDRSHRYYSGEWNRDKQAYEYPYKPNDELDLLYDFLCALGYEMSDEEKSMQNGSHPLFNSSDYA